MKKIFLYILAFVLLFPASFAFAAIYHVDPNGSNTPPYDSWAKAATQLNTIEGLDLNAGDVIYLSGTFSSMSSSDFTTGDSGSNIHPGSNADKTQEVENVNVSGSVVTFSTTPSGVSNSTDYVWIVNSFKGNSGVFKVTAVNGNNITVETSDLPGRTFVTENATDSPWTMKGAVIRPLRIIGCSVEGSPSGCTTEGYATITSGSSTFEFRGTDYVFISYIDIVHDGIAIRIGGADSWGCDFVALDHVKIRDYSHIGMIVSAAEYGTDCGGGDKDGTDQYYTVIQHGYFGHATEDPTECNTKEQIYFGRDERFQCVPYSYEWNGSIMYNEFDNTIGYTTDGNGCTGGDRSNTDGDQIDTKDNDRYLMIWGNYFHDSQNAPAYGIIKGMANEQCIANNYFADIDAASYGAISLMDAGNSNDSYIFNNIFYNNSGRMIASRNSQSYPNLRVYNNTFYGQDSSDYAIYLNAGLTIGYFYNNIIQNFANGVYAASGNGIINDDNNFFYSNTTNYSGWTPAGTIYTTDPGLSDPSNEDFSLSSGANAVGAGSDLSTTFDVDNHNAATPATLPGTQPIFRSGAWDIGAYEYQQQASISGVSLQ